MSKKLPNIFKNTNYGFIQNNKRVFYSNASQEDRVVLQPSESNLLEEEYFFNTMVEIETGHEKIRAKIVSKINDHILTSDNRTILLKDIRHIRNLS